MDSQPIDRPEPDGRHQRASEALREAFASHQDELLGMLCFLTGGVDQAQEALQQTFEKCWRHRRGAVEKVDLKAWIFRLAVSVARDRRHAAGYHLRAIDEAEATQLTDSISPPADPVERQDLIRLRRAISQFRSQEREIFLMRQNGALSYDEIAQSMSLPVAAVKARMRLALGRLREAMESRKS
jgi:RNA polymerase sigma-70 factor (ECF subfamily)